MPQKKVTAMVEAGVMAAVVIVFALIDTYVPVIGGFALVLCPVPISLLGMRHGFKWSIMTTGVAGILIAILLGPLEALAVVVGFGLVGIALGHAFRAGFSPAKALLWGSGAMLLSTPLINGLSILITGIDLWDTQLKVMDAGLGQAIDFYKNWGMSAEDLARSSAMLEYTKTAMHTLFPAGLAISAVFLTYINFLVSRIVLKRLGYSIPNFPPFKEWTMPQGVLYAFSLAAGLLLWGTNQQLPLVEKIAMNLLYVCGAPLFLQGMAVFYFLADKYNLSRLVRGIILLMVCINGLFALTAFLAGVFDLVMDYRRLRVPRSS